MQSDLRHLLKSGELTRRARIAVDRLASCRICPWECAVDRLLDHRRKCGTGRFAHVSSYFPHHGEEDCIRGIHGSGTIFFSQCNLHCVFCQNYDISHRQAGVETEPELLARMMCELQLMGCHNINLVTPTHVVPQIIEALAIAAGDGLRLPIVYNSSGFDRLETLALLDGVVDVYMPDFKCWDPATAQRLLDCPSYPQVAREAIREMKRQVGDLVLDADGIAVRGLLVRHLVLPGRQEESAAILRFLAEISQETCVNIMEQYRPAGKIGGGRFPEIDRRPTRREIDEVFAFARSAGLHRFC